jgi:hypothetical protein
MQEFNEFKLAGWRHPVTRFNPGLVCHSAPQMFRRAAQ